MTETFQTRSERYDLDTVRAIVGSTKHAILNVSTEGVLVQGELLGIGEGDNLTLTLQVLVRDRWRPMPVEGRVVRVDDRGAAIHYRDAARTWERLLRRLGEGQAATA